MMGGFWGIEAEQFSYFVTGKSKLYLLIKKRNQVNDR